MLYRHTRALFLKRVTVKPNTRELVRWFLTGSLCFGIDYVIFLQLYKGNVLWGSVALINALSFSVASGFNYFAHHKWTFKASVETKTAFTRYCLHLFVLWIFGTLILKSTLQLGLSPDIAKILPIIATVPLSFLSLKHFVFQSLGTH
jgi:putative flippase GtrA